MRLSRWLILPAIFCASLAPGPARGASAERSISVSRQFVVYGPDIRLRGAVCELAESTKKDLLGQLRRPDQWKLPVVIDAQLAQANLPEARPTLLTFSQTEGGMKLQLDLAIGGDVNPGSVRREILRALLLEIAFRDQPSLAAGSTYPQPPEWLLEGLAARQSGVDPARTLAPLMSIAAANKLAPLAEVLSQRPELLEPSSRVVYRAYCLALVEMVTATPDTAAKLTALLTGASASSADSIPRFLQQFPAFAADAAWKAGLFHQLADQRMRLLSVTETEIALRPLLMMTSTNAASASGYRLDEFAEFIDKPNAPATLHRLGQELLLLGTRANPIFRPIVAEYQQLASLLARKKTKGLGARFARLKTMRAELTRMTQGIDDYMNWFEATQAQGSSGLFTDYLKAAERTDDARPPRRDPISIYLSSLEAQLQN